MKKILFVFIILVISLLSFVFLINKKQNYIHKSYALDNYDWPQVGNNPQHTGYSPETLGTNFKIKWRYAFQPEKIYPQVQPVICNGKLFIGTEMGNVYAFDAVNPDPLNTSKGKVLWKKTITDSVTNKTASILTTAVCTSTRVFVAANDGSVYAFDTLNGNLLWKKELSKYKGIFASPVLVNNTLYVGVQNGYMYSIDISTGNILWSFKADSPILQTPAYNNNKVYFATMGMYVYALDATSGTQIWKTNKKPNMIFKDYWPVVSNDLVIIGAHGLNKFTYALQESTGNEVDFIAFGKTTMNGGPFPGCIDSNKNFITSIEDVTPNGWCGWGKYNMGTKQLTVLSDSANIDAGHGNCDENMTVTCSANLIFALHTEEGNAQYTGAFDLNIRKWYGGISWGSTNRQMSSNTQGGGASQGVIANSLLYHITWHELVVRSTQ